MNISVVDRSDKAIISSVAEVHVETFEGFFLTFMGKGFLGLMYRSYCEHQSSELMVARADDGSVLGFLAWSSDMSGLYKFMIKKHLISFAWYSLGAFLRKPAVFMRLVRAFLKPSEAKRDEKYVELSSIGVSKAAKGQGIGTALISELKERVDFSAYEYINLETDAVNNDAAKGFYVKNGFVPVREFETHEGRKMLEYRFYGEKK